MNRWIKTACHVFAGAVLAAMTVGLADGAPAAAPGPGFVAEISLAGPIGPAAAEYFDDAVQRAGDDGATAIVLRLDTPGGLSESMRQIVSRMLALKVPVLAYVAPGGARAASAGTYILYASQIAAMAPATHLGAATPVALGGSTPMPAPAQSSAKPGDAEANKVLNDAIAYIRSLAQLRGRNAEWAEQAVRGAATLTAGEAAQKHVIDFVASDVADLLRQADGRQVRVGETTLTLHVAGASVRAYDPDWRSAFLGIITNPTIAYMLLLAGIYGLVLEAFHPGAMLPGIVGGICILVGLYALQMLPVNYAGLALMALGVGLLVAEVFTPTRGALGIGGVVSFVVGSIMLLDTNVPGYAINVGVIGGLAFCAIVLLGLVLYFVMRSRRAHVVSGDQQMLDASGELLGPVEPGGEAQALVQGERWQVRSAVPLPAGARVRVVRREGLLLWVAPE
ncbi:MAG TPA: nodulation protein NfeD [Rhodanobacteraceae bacterium]|nr:nodulation protein NfeD [Rhodanobacteraceae bacterium]